MRTVISVRYGPVSEYPVTLSMLLEERERCLHALSVDNMLSIFAIGGIIPYSST